MAFPVTFIPTDMAIEFIKLLNRDDLPAIIIEYDTTFDLGCYFVSWLTFRFTEFMDLETNPMPTVGLGCLIHSRNSKNPMNVFGI